MQLIVNNVYHLTGEGFAESVLEDNSNLFRLVRIEDNGDWVFKGVTTGTTQFSGADMVKTGEAVITPMYPVLQKEKPKRAKRKKGERNKAPSVNKAKITFLSGESYTVKDFVSIEATAESVVFIMEDNWKGTVNYRQAITVPNDDVDTVVVRGVKDRFELDMTLTNMGITILRSDNAEILASELNIKL